MWPFGPKPSAGRRGEDLAARCLRRGGLKVLARNYRCPVGEADLVALDRATAKTAGAPTLVFVEVKTRSEGALVDPESAVNAAKRRQIVRVARYYLDHHDCADHNVRFDVVSVVLHAAAAPDIRHIPDAFSP